MRRAFFALVAGVLATALFAGQAQAAPPAYSKFYYGGHGHGPVAPPPPQNCAPPARCGVRYVPNDCHVTNYPRYVDYGRNYCPPNYNNNGGFAYSGNYLSLWFGF